MKESVFYFLSLEDGLVEEMLEEWEWFFEKCFFPLGLREKDVFTFADWQEQGLPMRECDREWGQGLVLRMKLKKGEDVQGVAESIWDEFLERCGLPNSMAVMKGRRISDCKVVCEDWIEKRMEAKGIFSYFNGSEEAAAFLLESHAADYTAEDVSDVADELERMSLISNDFLYRDMPAVCGWPAHEEWDLTFLKTWERRRLERLCMSIARKRQEESCEHERF